MKIAIVGVGGVGGYLGAKLIQNGLADVKLFARGEHLKSIQENGLKVIDNNIEFTVISDLSKPDKNEIFDVVFIATKSYDFKSSCKEIVEFIDDDTIILPLANGVNHKLEIREYLKRGIICDACVYIISHIKTYGVIYKKSELFYLVFGSEENTKKMQELSTLLNESGLKNKLSDNATYECWKKYLFISSFATMTSYFEKGMYEVYQDHEDVVKEVLYEIKSVANALDIPICEQDLQKVIKQVKNIPPNSKTSMQLDFEAGKKTELESLCGYIVQEAKTHNINAVWMSKMYKYLMKK
jgi:2-dehydropantoate 2-reductase